MYKRIIVLMLIAFVSLGISANDKNKLVVKKDKNSISFVVDKSLPAPKQKMTMLKGCESPLWDKNTLAASFKDDEFVHFGSAPFFKAMVTAYADHRPAVLSPDMIWLLVCQGFNRYVNENSEVLRDKFVSHEGKKKLEVESPCDVYSPDVNWEEIVNGFDKQIGENTKGNLSKLMVADFSTTGPVELTVSEMTMMSTVKSFFEYHVIYVSCGIPYITLEGTTDDWKSVLNRTKALDNYGMQWWTKDLVPILEEFVNASKGKVNRAFWCNIVKKHLVDELKGGGCSGDALTVLDGWFLKLMPYSKKGRTPDKVTHLYDDIISQMVSTDFTYDVKDLSGAIIKSVQMEMLAGFVGADIDEESGAVRPKIGWMVKESIDDKDKLQVLQERAGWDIIKVDKFPAILKKVDYLPSIKIHFVKEPNLPDWLDSVKIDGIELQGKFNEKDVERVKSLCPDRDVKLYKDSRISIRTKTSFAPSDYIYLNDVNLTPCSYPGNYGDYKMFIENTRKIKDSKRKDENGFTVFKAYVDVTFVVEKDGSITNITAHSRNGNKENEAEAIRVFSLMPKWKPAMKGNSPIRFRVKEIMPF